MKAIIMAIGSAGDLFPYIKIGNALKKRGHDVLVLSSENFQELIEKNNLSFASVATTEEYHKHITNIDISNKMGQANRLIVKYLMTVAMERIHQAVLENYEKNNTILISYQLCMGARIAQDKLGIPNVTLHLSPSSFISVEKTAKMYATKPVIGKFKIFSKFAIWLYKLMMYQFVKSETNELRKKIGLPVIKKLYPWIYSPDKVLGMYPEWLAETEPDFPEQSSITTFPLTKIKPAKLDPELKKFLNSGSKPIVFTPGSPYNTSAIRLFEMATTACKNLNERGIIVSKHKDLVPENLPEHMYYADFVDFETLLPLSKAVLHHGGIGTSAEALRAGIPQIIAPYGFDQPENAFFLKKLGLADDIKTKSVTAKELTAKIKALIYSTDALDKCSYYAKQLNRDDFLKETCDIIEEVFREKK